MKKSLDFEEIISILREQKEILKRKYKIKEIGIFGSYVRGEQKKKSDVDILIEFEEDAEISLLDFIEIELYLSKLIGKRVDLVEKSTLKPFIGKNILKEIIYL